VRSSKKSNAYLTLSVSFKVLFNWRILAVTFGRLPPHFKFIAAMMEYICVVSYLPHIMVDVFTLLKNSGSF
jgi:hypothetical protein